MLTISWEYSSVKKFESSFGHQEFNMTQKKSTQRKKLYGIVLKDVSGKFFGYIDKSLTSMGWSNDSIMVKDEEWCKGHMSDPGYRRAFFTPYLKRGCEIFIVRLHSKTCPINVNFNETDPRRSRNHLFTVKS